MILRWDRLKRINLLILKSFHKQHCLDWLLFIPAYSCLWPISNSVVRDHRIQICIGFHDWALFISILDIICLDELEQISCIGISVIWWNPRFSVIISGSQLKVTLLQCMCTLCLLWLFDFKFLSDIQLAVLLHWQLVLSQNEMGSSMFKCNLGPAIWGCKIPTNGNSSSLFQGYIIHF